MIRRSEDAVNRFSVFTVHRRFFPKIVKIFTGRQWRIQGGVPLWTKVFLISCSFLGKSGKFVCWRPLLRGILDPPLGGLLRQTKYINHFRTHCLLTNYKTKHMIFFSSECHFNASQWGRKSQKYSIN